MLIGDSLLTQIKIIQNSDQLLKARERYDSLQKERKLLFDLLEETIRAVHPKEVFKKKVQLKKDDIIINNTQKVSLKDRNRIFIIGAGKASGQMAIELAKILNDKLTQGIVNVPKKIINELQNLNKWNFPLEFSPADHPTPSKKTIKGTKKILQLVEETNPNDLIFCLISGGGSALLELPIQSITLNDLTELFNRLTENGATIHELNIVRKHLSSVKGGKLLRYTSPAEVVSLIISDVIDDKLDTIASGPTAPDTSSWLDVKNVLKKYHLWNNKMFIHIQKIIQKGIENQIEDTLKKDNKLFNQVRNILLATNKNACIKIREGYAKKGYKTKMLQPIYGEARDIGKTIAEKIVEVKEPTAIIAGGETTVRIKGSGKGGRNQELALAAVKTISDRKDILLCSIASDGIDGPTNAAGAIIDGITYQEGLQKGLQPETFLEKNDSYHYFKKINGLIITGQTGTNVMDLVIGVKIKNDTSSSYK
jgi:glycerate-2-kinase